MNLSKRILVEIGVLIVFTNFKLSANEADEVLDTLKKTVEKKREAEKASPVKPVDLSAFKEMLHDLKKQAGEN